MAASSQAQNTLSLYRYQRTNKAYTEDLGKDVRLTLMLIPAGNFIMGAPEDEPESRDNERPQHHVELSQFFLGRYPITQAQWRVVAGYDRIERDLEREPSRFKGDNRPVEQVSWDDAVEFCQRLSAKSGKDYRLPSEARWEYACRAGMDTPFHFGETILPDLANYATQYSYRDSPTQESRGQTTDVGTFRANDWGLYDMHGNVFEWCEDTWPSNYEEAPTDGSAWTDVSSNLRVLRGGSWDYGPWDCRSASRGYASRAGRGNGFGFRVCCVPPRSLLS